MNLSEYAADAILDGTAMPATLYAQLHTGNPGVDGTANVSATTDRKSFTRDAASGGATAAAAIMEWASMTSDETISHVSAWDSATVGDAWWIGALPMATQVLAGVGASIPDGEMTLAFDVWS